MDELLQKFLEEAPVAVMVRATLVRTMADSTLDDLFERQAESQYTRELTFGALIRLMTQVVFRTSPFGGVILYTYNARRGSLRWKRV
jgi:precorrin-4 methylase